MKYLISLIALVLVFSPLQAAQKYKNKKQYVPSYHEIFLYDHGMYLPFPGKLYRVRAIYWDKKMGYYTYKSKMKNVPLSQMKYYDWKSLKN